MGCFELSPFFACFQSEIFLKFFKAFMTLPLLKITGLLFCSTFLSLGFSDFLLIRFMYWSFVRDITEVMMSSSYHTLVNNT